MTVNPEHQVGLQGTRISAGGDKWQSHTGVYPSIPAFSPFIDVAMVFMCVTFSYNFK